MNEAPVENASAQEEDYVKVGMLSTIVVWNPMNPEMVEDYMAYSLIYSCLFFYDQNWEGPVNDLATSYWDWTDGDGTWNLEINITTNAYFRDFSTLTSKLHPLDARDVAFTLNLIKDNPGGAWDWYLLDYSYFTPVETSPGVWDQVRFSCSYEKAIWMDDLVSIPIVPKYIWEDITDPLKGQKPEDQVGSGPFVFESWARDSWYMFKTAPNYHGATDYGPARTVDPDIPGVMFRVLSEPTTMTIEVNKGNIDCAILTGSYSTFEEVLGKSASVDIYKAAVSENGITDIAINAIPDAFDSEGYMSHHPALLDPFVRKAIFMTLNKDYIVDKMLGGRAVKGTSVVAPGWWQADIQNLVPYDPQGAEDMLMANGWDYLDGDDWLDATEEAYGVQEGWFPEGTELSGIRCQAVNTDPNYKDIADAWPGWADDAGIELIGTTETETTMINKAWYQADYDIWVWHWGWFPEPITGALSVWVSTEIEKGGDNCEMPMGEWWAYKDEFGDANLTDIHGQSVCPFVSQQMIEDYGILDAPWVDDDGISRFSSFDQNLTDAMKIMDKDERKVYTDRLQQMIYDSYTELVPYYDLGLYGFTDYRFDNWGDWEAHPGLAVTAGMPWIYFQLEVVDDRKPKFDEPPEDTYTAYADMPEAFSIAVSDYESSPLWVNISYGDGDIGRHTLTGDTTVPRWINTTHTYDTEGLLTLNVSLTDGYLDEGEPRYVYREAVVEVQGEFNAPPRFVSLKVDTPSPIYINEEVTWMAVANDSDSGDFGTGLKFTWDWDDDTYDVDEKASVANGTHVTSEVTHSWSVPNVYTVEVSVYDYTGLETGDHNVSITKLYTVRINEPPMEPVVQDIYGLVNDPTECVAISVDADLEELTFTWDWGDGTYNVTKSAATYEGMMHTSLVTRTWTAADTYDVTVYVEDEYGHNESTSATATIVDSGNVPPTAVLLSWSPDPIFTGANTTFNLSARDANGDAIDFSVDLGDDNTTAGSTTGGTTTRQYWEFNHTYWLPDLYEVTVTAGDGTDELVAIFYVPVIEPVGNVSPDFDLQSSFTAQWGKPISVHPLNVFDANDDEVTVWYDWGDGSLMTKGDPDNLYTGTHTYAAIGQFTLTVYADDGTGLEGHNVSKTAMMYVVEANQKPAVERIVLSPVKEEYTTGEMITFTVTVSDLEGDNVVVTIDYGDGASDEVTRDLEAKIDANITFEHAYDSSDDFVVTVTVEDDKAHSNMTWNYATKTVTVVKPALNLLLIGGVVAGIIAAIAAIAIFLNRRKKGPAAPAELEVGGMEGMAPPPPDEPGTG